MKTTNQHTNLLGVPKPQYCHPSIHASSHQQTDDSTAAWSGYPFVVGSQQASSAKVLAVSSSVSPASPSLPSFPLHQATTTIPHAKQVRGVRCEVRRFLLRTSHFAHLILLLLITTTLSAQPTIQWDKTFGNSENDGINTLIEAQDGNIIAAGFTTPTHKNSIDLWVFKVNKQGDIIWEMTKGSDNGDQAHHIVESPDGSIYVVGFTTPNNNYQSNGWLLKLSTTGQLLWEKQLGIAGISKFRHIIYTQDGQLALAGSRTPTGQRSEQMWLVKTDLEGNLLWEYGYGGDLLPPQKKAYDEFSKQYKQVNVQNGEAANALTQTQNGDFVLVGYSGHHASHQLATNMWVIRINTQGQQLWDKAFGTLGGDIAYSVHENADQSLNIVGERYDKTKDFNHSMWMLQLDRNGNKIWDRQYNHGDFDFARHSFQTNDQQYLLVGDAGYKDRSQSKYKQTGVTANNLEELESADTGIGNTMWAKHTDPVTGKTEWRQMRNVPQTKVAKQPVGRDVWIVKTDRDGNKIWDKRLEGAKEDRGYAGIQLRDGNYVIAAQTNSKGAGKQDAWLIMLH